MSPRRRSVPVRRTLRLLIRVLPAPSLRILTNGPLNPSIELPIRGVLPRVRRLQTPIVHVLEKAIEARGEQTAHRGSDPVDPVITLELPGGYTGSETAGRVDGGAGVVDSCYFDYEEREADAYRGEEGVFGFVGCEDEDGEDELGGEELVVRGEDSAEFLWDWRTEVTWEETTYHFEEYATCDAHAWSEGGFDHCDGTRNDRTDDRSRADRPEDLRG